MIFERNALFLEVANKFDASLFHRRRCHNIHIGFRGTFIHTFGDIRRTSTYSFIVRHHFQEVLQRFLSKRPAILGKCGSTVIRGVEADIEIFRPLFSKTRFPKLTYLGIVNSEEQDEIVKMFLESDILPQLETMDISAGVLKDEGAQLLLDNMDKIAHLKFINMRYNYLSKGMKKKLQELPMKIDIAESEEADEDDGEMWYYPMITE